MIRRLYIPFAAAVLLLYGASAVRGWEIGIPRKGVIPQEMRQKPGGYRSYGFWSGGK